ncbi:MAG: glutathione S-transferase family protein [Deltaproteobacteria bacterium]|nr:glutathione S-transferase family protein [Deltaproteobacteria bacterium]
MIQIYGSPRSSAGRCYWLLEELGLAYRRQPLDMRAKEHKSERYLRLNPTGKVPCLVDGELTIWESMAINQYLVDEYPSPLGGATPEERGLIAQWSYWSILDLQRPLIDMFIQLVFVPEPKRDHGVIERARALLPPLLEILDRHLASREYLVADRFTVADLNVASVVSICGSVGHELTPYRAVDAWLARCKARPAHERYAALDP